MTGRRAGGLAGGLAVVLLTASPPARLPAQDTNAIDRGVRIGIVYRPGVRPGMVMLPRKGLDSVRAMVVRDLDYSDRFEIITLPGGDSIRLATGAPRGGGTTPRGGRTPTSSSSGTGGGAQSAIGSLNYPLYQALG